MADGTQQVATVKQRSPEHPSIDLRQAITRARVFYEHERFNYAAVDVAKAHWGYGPVSSSGLRILAALIHFGLLEATGDGGQRRVRLTELAKSILVDNRDTSPERDEALRKAALRPRIYAALWKEWSDGLPSDSQMEFDLVRTYKFNPDSVRAFIKDFKATIAYANLLGSPNEDKPDVESIHEKLRRAEEFRPFSQSNASPQATTMSATQFESNAAPPLDLPIPLMGGRRAILRIPPVLSQAEYDLILEMVSESMARMRPMIVRSPAEGGP